MIIKRPIASLSVVEVDSLPNLVVCNRVLVTIIGIRTRDGIDVRRWNVGENPYRRW